MLRYTVERVPVGSVLAASIYDGRGNLLMREGTELTAGHLELLRRRGVKTVLVDHPEFRDLVLSDPISPDLLREALRSYGEVAVWIRTKSSGTGSDFDWEPFRRMAKRLLEEVGSGAEHRCLLHATSHDQQLAVHCLNVAIVAVRLARDVVRPDQLVEVGLGALLHDVGRLVTGDRAGEIPSPLEPPTEEERQHPLRGLALIRGVSTLSAFAKVVVLQHHERQDGSGFPHGTRAPDLHPIAQVVGLADAYVSLLEARGGLPPDQAVEWVMTTAGREFDHRLVSSFVNHVDPYPLGVEVRLSSGEEGVVVRQTGVRTRPVVRVVAREGRRVEACYDVDLTSLDRQTTVIQWARPLVSV